MFRFIFYFFFFGMLFYLIWLFFPDAFHILVNWASTTFAYIKAFIATLTEKIHQNGPQPFHQNSTV